MIRLLFLFIVFLGTQFHSKAQDWAGYKESLDYFYGKDNIEKAFEYATKALEAAKKEFGEQHTNYATSLNDLGLLYKVTGNYKKTEECYVAAKELRKKLVGEEHTAYLLVHDNLASFYIETANYLKAEPLLHQSIAIRKRKWGNNAPDMDISLQNLANYYTDLGLFERAEPLYLESNEITRQVYGNSHSYYAAGLNNLAMMYSMAGQYDKSEIAYLKALEIKRNDVGENSIQYASGLSNLGLLYQRVGQYKKAETLYLQAADIQKKQLGQLHPEYATTLNNYGLLMQADCKKDVAESALLEAGRIWQQSLGENHPTYFSYLNNLANIYNENGQIKKAEEFYTKALSVCEKVFTTNHPSYATTLNSLGYVYLQKKDYAIAKLLMENAFNIRKGRLGENHPQYSESLKALAMLFEESGDVTKAAALQLEFAAMDIKNMDRVFYNLAEEEKNRYMERIMVLNNWQNSFLYNHPRQNNITINNYNLQLKLKSLSLADSKNTLALLRSSKDSLIKKEFSKLQFNKSVLSKQYAMPVGSQQVDVVRLEKETEAIEKELTRRSQVFNRNQQNTTIKIADLQKKLTVGEAAIEFVRFQLYNKKWTDSIMYAAYILKKNDSVPVFVPLFEEKQLQKLFDSVSKDAAIMANNFYRGLDPDEEENSKATLGKQLYNLVWQPLEPHLKGIKKIAYSPAGKLYNIAFNALMIDSSTTLMDKYQLQQYTSTRNVALRTVQVKNNKPLNITLFGNPAFTMDSAAILTNSKKNTNNNIYTPQNRSARGGSWNDLPGTATEVKKINDLFIANKTKARIFTATAASETNLKAVSGNSPQLLHIATHGFFLPDPYKKKLENGFNQNDNTYSLANDPLLRSGLILAGANYAWSNTPIEGLEDGILTAYEIAQLDLSNTELVVLSACETALGDVKGSEGVFGLQRAFKMAGVKKMIVSLWQVPDKETAELMTAFYSYWLKGKRIEQAFATAQAEMKKKYPPFYWAAFVLVE